MYVKYLNIETKAIWQENFGGGIICILALLNWYSKIISYNSSLCSFHIQKPSSYLVSVAADQMLGQNHDEALEDDEEQVLLVGLRRLQQVLQLLNLHHTHMN